MVKRIIFDLDNTLINWDSKWDYLIRDTFLYYQIPCDDELLEKFLEAEHSYEKAVKRFNMVEMSHYIGNYLGISLPDDFIEHWTILLRDCVSLEPNLKLIALLEKLSKKYSLVVATNWFTEQQVIRLKKEGIFSFFDEVVGNDLFDSKPNEEVFRYFMRGYRDSEVVMVGDDYLIDVVGANQCGLFSYLITKDSKYQGSSQYQVISNIYELEEYL